MKKRIKGAAMLFACLSLSLGLLGGCGGSTPESSAPAVPDGTGTTAGSTESTDGTVPTMTGQDRTAPSATASASAGTTAARGTAAQKPLSGKIELKLVPLPGDKSSLLLSNPDRGFRMETYYTLKTKVAYPNSNISGTEFFDQMYFDYLEDQPQLTQAFFYITEYCTRDFDQAFFDEMNAYFAHMREMKVRLLIRFVYQWDENDRQSCPSVDQVLRHIAQLKPLIAKNADVIHCWQAGFLGNWGEWHNMIVPVTNEDKANILKAIVNNSPADMFIQTRMVEYRDTLPDSAPEKARIGYHDDYLTGFPQRWSCGLTPDDPAYERMIGQSSSLLIDGEMPWGNDELMGKEFNGLDMAKYLSTRHFTSMSLIHHYRDGGLHSMTKWKTQAVAAATLEKNGLRYAPGWYTAADGSKQKQTIFAYIQQYLGYHLQASAASATADERSVQAAVSLKNYGFAAPMMMKSIELVLTEKDGTVVSRAGAADPKLWQPGVEKQLTGTLSVPDKTKEYYLGVRFVNNAGTGARLANDLPFIDGVNILGRVR